MENLKNWSSSVWWHLKNVISEERMRIVTREGEMSRRQFYLAVFLVVVFWVITLYPGFFSNDPLDQWSQAQVHRYSTWHPIIMAVLWHYLAKVFGVGAFFILNQVMYWFGLALFVDVVLGRRLRYLLLAFFPPILMMSFNVWKDVACMTALTLAVAFFLYWIEAKKKWMLTVSMVFLGYASLVRLNGFIPAATLVTVGAFCFWKGSVAKKMVISLCLTLLLGGSVKVSSSLQNFIYKPHIDHPLPTLLVWDIAGIYVNAGLDVAPPPVVHVTNKTTAETWLKGYSHYGCSICWTSGISCQNESTTEDKALMNFWLKVVLEQPKAYLKHRWSLVKVLWGLQHRVYFPYQGFEQNHQVGGIFVPGPVGDTVYKLLNKRFHVLEVVGVFQPYVWILVCVGVIAIAGWRCRRKFLTNMDKVAVAVATSGITNAVSLVFLAVAADYRYMIWTILAGVLSLVLVLAQSVIKRNATYLP